MPKGTETPVTPPAPVQLSEILINEVYFVVGYDDGKLFIEPPFRFIAGVYFFQHNNQPNKIWYEGLSGARYPERYARGYLIAEEIGLVAEEELPNGFDENYHRTFKLSAHDVLKDIVDQNDVASYEKLIGKRLPPHGATEEKGNRMRLDYHIEGNCLYLS